MSKQHEPSFKHSPKKPSQPPESKIFNKTDIIITLVLLLFSFIITEIIFVAQGLGGFIW